MKIRFLIILNCLFLQSCSVYESPNPPKEEVKVEVVSFDQNEQNGGIIDFVKGKGWLITQHAANRYIELTKKYGNMFLPPLKKGQGLIQEEDHYILSQEYMVKFAEMNNAWKLSK